MRVDDAIKALVPSGKEYEEVLAYAASLPDAPKSASGKPERRKEDRDTVLGLLESNIRMRSRLTLLEEENKALQRRIGEFKQGTGMDREMRSSLQSKDMQIRRLQALLNRKEEELSSLKKRSSDVVVSSGATKSTTSSVDKRKHADISEEEPEKDLKGGKEDSGLGSIVDEYRQSRAREGKRF
jgi:predicted RNase H-like nuclease (RuvC/YqgF family)